MVGRSAASRPQSFWCVSRREFNNQTSWKKERWYQWTMTCRGNMFWPGQGVYPDDRWREMWTLARASQPSGGDAFLALVRSVANLNADLQDGIDLHNHDERLQRLAIRIENAAEWDRTSLGVRLAELFRELQRIYLDATKVWKVKQSIPVLQEEATIMQKRTSAGSSEFDRLADFKSHVTNYGIPLQDYLQNGNGLEVIAERYALPITVTESGFTTIPMDAVDQIVAVAREKKREIDALRVAR